MNRSFDNVEMSEAYRRKIIADGMRTHLLAQKHLPRPPRWRLAAEAVVFIAGAALLGAAVGLAM